MRKRGLGLSAVGSVHVWVEVVNKGVLGCAPVVMERERVGAPEDKLQAWVCPRRGGVGGGFVMGVGHDVVDCMRLTIVRQRAEANA